MHVECLCKSDNPEHSRSAPFGGGTSGLFASSAACSSVKCPANMPGPTKSRSAPAHRPAAALHS